VELLDILLHNIMGGINPDTPITATAMPSINVTGSAPNGIAVAPVLKEWNVPTPVSQKSQQGSSASGNPLMDSLGQVGMQAALGLGKYAYGQAKQASYNNQFGSDMMSSDGFYQTPSAAKAAGIENPTYWGQGGGLFGTEGTGFYGGAPTGGN
jgi:hypothetical protein